MKYSLLCSANDWMQSKKKPPSIDGRRQDPEDSISGRHSEKKDRNFTFTREKTYESVGRNYKLSFWHCFYAPE